ncbi:hypothetical protein BDY24DRAFT_400308 [Mrakia frigida]|uniref:uncharacterized protein n=1 Tax=Mrakia frigida TaxID=29902 RepID=UPI003FCC2289
MSENAFESKVSLLRVLKEQKLKMRSRSSTGREGIGRPWTPWIWEELSWLRLVDPTKRGGGGGRRS